MFPGRRLLFALIALCSFIDFYLLLLSMVAAETADAENMVWAFTAAEAGIVISALTALVFCLPKGKGRKWAVSRMPLRRLRFF
jgi:hypothetical protein